MQLDVNAVGEAACVLRMHITAVLHYSTAVAAAAAAAYSAGVATPAATGTTDALPAAVGATTITLLYQALTGNNNVVMTIQPCANKSC